MSRNCEYELKHGLTFKAPEKVVDKLLKEGYYISSSCGRYIQVCKQVGNKKVYTGLLKNFVKPGAKKFKDGNTLNITLSNLI